MTPSQENSNEESSIGRKGCLARFGRRPFIESLGVASALSVGSGITTASSAEFDEQGEGNESGGDDAEDSRQIDSTFGYPTTEPGDIPTGLDPDHEVELHREFPEDPENPEHPSIFHFEPSGLQIESGDVVQFTFTDPNHTVTAYHPDHGYQRRVPEGVPAFSAPIVQKDGAWLYRFDTEGLYDLYCGPHQIAGMAMRVVVGELDEGDVPQYEDTFEAEPPLFAPLTAEQLEHELNANSDRNEDVEWVWPTDRQILDADALNPTAIQEAGEVSFTEVADELDIAYEEDHEEEEEQTD